MTFKINPLFLVDSYKVSHLGFTAKGTQVIYSNLTARSFDVFKRMFPDTDMKSVFFGLQAFMIDVLINQWNDNFFNRPKDEVIAEVDRVFGAYLGGIDSTHFGDLHDLGYLPIEIKALPEGSLVPVKVPYFTIQNTHDDFQWITNYLETIISSELWKVITVATVGREFRKLSNAFALKTTGSTAGTEFQNHDFSFRGQSNWHSAASLGAAFLLSSNGTDNIPAIPWLEHYYDANIDKEFIAASVPASEHSVSCLGSAVSGEFDFIRHSITEAYPTGIVSIVSDTYDYWKVITEFLPALKEDILARQENSLGLAKVVIRPDCYDELTQIFTPFGWKYFKDLHAGELVAQVLDDGSYAFVVPTKNVNEPYKGPMIHFKDNHGKVDLMVTPNHRMVINQKNIRTGNIAEKIVEASAMSNSGNHLQTMSRSSSAINKAKSLTFIERLNIAFQADGSYVTGTASSIRFSFSKERKINRLRDLLEENNVKFTIYNLADGKVEFNIKLSASLFSKDFSWVDISDLCSNWCQEFIEEMSHWDSSIRSIGRIKFDTVNKPVMYVVEIIALSAGYGCLISTYEDIRQEHFSNVYTANILTDNLVGGQSWTKTEVAYDGNVYCVTVPSGKLLVKRNRCTLVSGNSGDPVKIICGYHVGSKEFADVDEAYNFYDGNLYNLPEVIKVGNTYRTIDAIDPGRVSLGKELSEAEVKGSIQCLWDIFGGTINEQGYKVLNPRIGLIYGDSITYERAKKIYTQLADKGFASLNVVFGVGSYALSVHSRDTLGMAIKATAAKVDGKWIELFKDPKTDDGTKKSAKGLLSVVKDASNGDLCLLDQRTPDQEDDTGELRTVFYNGNVVTTTFAEVKQRLWG